MRITSALSGAAVALGLSLLTGLFPAVGQPRVYTVPAGEPGLTGSPLPRDALPDTHIGRGGNDIAEAWLAEPTDRLHHGVLGDSLEAKTLRVLTRSGAVLSYRLPGGSVFEDLCPRVHDVDNDGHDEVLLVQSRQEAGASLMALGVRDGALAPLAETEPIGEPNRWLNPVGVADVDGDGRLEVLVVLTPHVGGTLVSFRFDGRTFHKVYSIRGVSNHRIGSRAMKLSAFVDVNGDGIPEVVVPTPDRSALRAISFSTGVPIDIARINLPSPVDGDFEFYPPYTLIVPLEDGRRERIVWR